MRALAVVLLAFAAAGCGSDASRPTRDATPDAVDSRERYEQVMRAITMRLAEEAQATVPDVPSGASLPEQAVQMRGLGKFMRKFATELDKITPPPEIQDAHEDFVAGNRDLARFFEDLVAPAMERNRKRVVKQLVATLESGTVEAVQKIRRAREAYEAAGYTLPGQVIPGQSGFVPGG